MSSKDASIERRMTAADFTLLPTGEVSSAQFYAFMVNILSPSVWGRFWALTRLQP